MSKHDCRQQQVSLDRTAGPAVAIQNMHDIFTDSYRRAILHYLQQVDGAVSLGKVVFTVEERCPDEYEYRDRPQGWLRDDHIRPMAEFGVLDYDRDEDVVHLPDDVSFSVTHPWAAE